MSILFRMEQTDRQTDSKARGSHWSLTIYDPGELNAFQSKDGWPLWVKKAVGQEEICPTTGKHHWQCYLQTEQIRFSSLKKWLPTAHIEIARNKNALKQYVAKSETAVDGTKFDITTDKEHLGLHQQLELFARCWLAAEDEIKKTYYGDLKLKPGEVEKKVYWFLVNIILRDNPEQAAMFANPALERMWVNTWMTWVDLAREASKAGDA